MPAIDIDRDAAHEAAQRELAKPIYPKASLTERSSDWLDDLLYRIAAGGFAAARRLVHHRAAAHRAGRRGRGRGPDRAAHHAHQPRRRPGTVRRARAERRRSTAQPPNGLRPRAIGRRRSVIGCAPSHGSSRKTGVLNPVRAGPRPSWRATPARPLPDLGSRIDARRNSFQRRHLRRAAGHRARLPDDRRPRRPPTVPRCDDCGPVGDACRHRRLGGRSMTNVHTAIAPTVRQRWRAGRWVLAALVVITAVAALTTYLTAPRPGGRMDAEPHLPDGCSRAGHAAARPRCRRGRGRRRRRGRTGGATGHTLLIAQTYYLVDDDVLRRLADCPATGCWSSRSRGRRDVLAPEVRRDAAGTARWLTRLRSAGGHQGRATSSSAPSDTYRGDRRCRP